MNYAADSGAARNRIEDLEAKVRQHDELDLLRYAQLQKAKDTIEELGAEVARLLERLEVASDLIRGHFGPVRGLHERAFNWLKEFDDVPR
jgi:hypothetical protein